MKNRFRRRKPKNGDMELQITAMADIFTILLVFLLKSFAGGALNISPSQGMKLPQAKADLKQVEALKIEVSEHAVNIEQKPVATLEHYRFPKGDIQSNGSSKVLGEALKIARDRQNLIASANSDVKVDAKVVVIADQKVPYSTVKTVLASAAVQGFTDFKLAVVTPE